MSHSRRPKLQPSIEVWRNEVSAYTPSCSSCTSEIHRKPSFWRRLLRPIALSTNHSNGGGTSESGGMKNARESKEADVRTEMYSRSEEEGEIAQDGGEGDGSSMELGSRSDGFGGLRERMERLERARRLLEGRGRSGGGGSGKG